LPAPEAQAAAPLPVVTFCPNQTTLNAGATPGS
jgi:hypothetical protein